MAQLDKERQQQGLPSLPFGAALHLGEMLWGNIGAADRLDFTAIGPAVNLVSRVGGYAARLGRRSLRQGCSPRRPKCRWSHSERMSCGASHLDAKCLRCRRTEPEAELGQKLKLGGKKRADFR
jgi:hypothetical protein